MRIKIRIAGRFYPVPVPTASALSVEVAGATCPECGVAPVRVAGTGSRIAEDDRAYESDAVCIDCRKAIGIIRAETETLFGVAEDERMAATICRKY